MAPKKKKKSGKGWHRVGTYSKKSKAEKRSKNLRADGKKTKTTSRMQKVRKTPKGRKVIHPLDYPGGRKIRIYRVYAK